MVLNTELCFRSGRQPVYIVIAEFISEVPADCGDLLADFADADNSQILIAEFVQGRC